jgi:hypothetical protein
MSTVSDARFWDLASRKYALGAISDQLGYERTLDRTLALIRSERPGPGTGLWNRNNRAQACRRCPGLSRHRLFQRND